MPKPRVIHVYKDYYPPVVGGIEKTINLMAEGLQDEFDVRVLVANRRVRTEEEARRGVHVMKVASLGRVASAPLAPRFAALMREWRSDIWHFHCPHPTGELAWLWARPEGRAVVSYHSDIVRQRWALWAYGPFLRRFLRQVDVVMPTSPDYRDTSPWLRPIRERCRIVPLGVALERFEPTPELKRRAQAVRERLGGGPVVLFVGRFRYYKGLQFLLPAMTKVPAARLALVGDGPMRPRLESLARSLGIAGRIHWAGEVCDAELPAWYYAADVFCLPSHLRSEAFGIAQIEAMACGVPVVSCRLNSGVPFVNRDGQTGRVVEPGDWRALAAGLNELLGDGELRRRLGEGARRRAWSEFSAAVMCDRVRAVYRSVLDKDDRKPS
ncbi:MAG: glycosyltransferase [Candidatus Sumerlaeia bacterium]